MQRRAALVVGLVLAMLSPFVAPALAGSGPAISLGLTPVTVTYGHKLHASGAVQDPTPTCVAGRTVELEQKAAGTSAWNPLGTTNTDENGAYAFTKTPQSNAWYRTTAMAAIACGELHSTAVKGRVAAAVDLALARGTAAAGSCVKATISVRPAKGGQRVVLQEQGSSGWRAVRALTLDGSSVAVTRLCYGWAGIGRHVFRGRWASQDVSNATGTSAPAALSVLRAAWMKRIDHLSGGRAVGVSIRAHGHVLYQRNADSPFAPASNEKLLLSMALLDRFPSSARIDTSAAARRVANGVVRGDLWILGHGDPSTGPRSLGALARAVAGAGVKRITGRVMGSTAYFAHDWFAPGWKRDFPKDEIALPSALTFRGNHLDGRNVSDPERFAAKALLQRLRARGVKIAGRPGSGVPPAGLGTIATVESPTLAGLLRHMDHESDNFYAEVLGKALAAAAAGPPGTIAHGADTIASWVRAHGASVTAHDSSGLSYWNRVAAGGMTRLLAAADASPWGATLRNLLPSPGQGTLEHRLAGVKLHAKTGTLERISALSGWVWLSQLQDWAQFSILDRGMSYTTEKSMEDAIVHTMADSAH